MIIGKDSLLNPTPEQEAIDHGSGRMPDPLTHFDWSTLMTRYDRLAPNGDRQKHYDLIEAFAGGITPTPTPRCFAGSSMRGSGGTEPGGSWRGRQRH